MPSGLERMLWGFRSAWTTWWVWSQDRAEISCRVLDSQTGRVIIGSVFWRVGDGLERDVLMMSMRDASA